MIRITLENIEAMKNLIKVDSILVIQMLDINTRKILFNDISKCRKIIYEDALFISCCILNDKNERVRNYNLKKMVKNTKRFSIFLLDEIEIKHLHLLSSLNVDYKLDDILVSALTEKQMG